jgi:hypothetical protein
MKKVVVFVSAPEAGGVREAIAQSGAGRIGNYSETVNHVHTGYSGAPRVVDEERIEFACDDATFVDIMSAIDGLSPHSAAVDSWNLDHFVR